MATSGLPTPRRTRSGSSLLGTEFAAPTTGDSPEAITKGPDGNLWFTEFNHHEIGRMTPTDTVTNFVISAHGSYPEAITAGPDGNLWFTEPGGRSKIGRMTPTGTVTEFPVSHMINGIWDM